MQYQKGITPVISDQNSSQVPTIRVPSITSDPTEDWKTYTIDDSLQFKYPQSYSIFANQWKIIIKSPISICNPKLTFNLEEY